MINLQPTEKQRLRPDGTLFTQGAPWLTIQGEGPLVGTPAIFVRLSGCNWNCPLCDTDYTSERVVNDLGALVQRTIDAAGGNKVRLIVLTGGEPFRQNVGPFVRELLFQNFRVQVETNGTLFVEDFPWASPDLTVVCSPKTPVVNEKIRPYVQALKYVVKDGKVGDDGLPLTTMGQTTPVQKPWDGFRGEVFLQPLDEQDSFKNGMNTAACLKACMRFGYRLSYQVHKAVGVA